MKTIRRGYFYLVSLISLEVVTWSVIGLLQSIFDTTRIGGGTDQLAGALSSIVVGVVVFAIHWRVAQKEAGEDSEEQFSGVRSVFFYGTLGNLIYHFCTIFIDSHIPYFGKSIQCRNLSIWFRLQVNTSHTDSLGRYPDQFNNRLLFLSNSRIPLGLKTQLEMHLRLVAGFRVTFGNFMAWASPMAGLIQILTFLLSFSEDTLGAGRALDLGNYALCCRHTYLAVQLEKYSRITLTVDR